ncbi:phage tail protein [Marinomonas atlantica]|uniref:phage tail protein n=1 Tax=Marinomonas atlantica TaxID=1806668 RepID=UPI00083395BC|nr:phage tail protein [Marinomonas atlantica]
MSTKVTLIGQTKLAGSVASDPLELYEVAVGSGVVVFDENTSAMTALVNEEARFVIPSGGIATHESNENWIGVTVVIPLDSGGYTIREIGVFDNDGDLIAIGSFPETEKPAVTDPDAREIEVTMWINVGADANVSIVIDPQNQVTEKFVSDSLSAHAQGRDHPQATETDLGFARLATTEEAVAGQSNSLSVTPTGVKASVEQNKRSNWALNFYMGNA